MAVDELSKKNPDGTRLGQSASDLVAFHGVTPVAQASAITSLATTAVVTACGVFGFSSAAQASGLVTAVNAIIVALNAKGLTA